MDAGHSSVTKAHPKLCSGELKTVVDQKVCEIKRTVHVVGHNFAVYFDIISIKHTTKKRLFLHAVLVNVLRV